MNVQKEKEIKDLELKIKNTKNHILINKKDHSAKIAVMRYIGRIRSLKKYLHKINKTHE